MGFKSHIKKKNTESCPGLAQVDRRVDRVWSSHCTGQSFNKLRPGRSVGPVRI